jgi:multimeric flavodoxin WrbA
MKLLLINSSARVGGNTARTMDLFEETFASLAKERGICIETERVNLSRLALKTCLGCRVCFDNSEQLCPLKDGLLDLSDKLLAADGYVIASPVYVEDVNGIMKNWIDRMAFNSHRPAFYGKSALLFTSSAVGSTSHALTTMRTAFGTWAIKTLGGLKFRLGAITEPEEIRKRYANRIQRSARRLVRSIQKQPFRPSFYSLIAFTVQQAYWRKNTSYLDTYDYAFWKKAGWLDRNRRYYDPAMARSSRVIVARMLGKFIALFFG